MADYIDRDALMQVLSPRLAALNTEYGEYDGYTEGFDECLCTVEDFPSTWHDAKTDPPKPFRPVLLYRGDAFCEEKTVGWYMEKCGQYAVYTRVGFLYVDDVTHWMELPEVPS